VKKGETLRGRGEFSALFERGSKLDSGLVRCFFRFDQGAGTPLRAGFSVSSRTFNAVKRNRIRRLMRVAFDSEAEILRSGAVGGELKLVFVFRGREGFPVGKLRLADLRNDIGAVCRQCASRLPRGGP
jgi:ribonuclease P protein component